MPNHNSYGEIDYDFNPDAEYSYFGDPYADQNPNVNQAWDDFANLDVDAYSGDQESYSLPSFFDTTWGTISDFASNSWDFVSGLFTQASQQFQANNSQGQSFLSSINPIIILLGAYLLLKK